MEKKALGKLLRLKRKKLKLSLVEIYKTSGGKHSPGKLSPSYLSALEKGKVTKTRYDKLVSVSNIYDVDIEIIKSAFQTTAREAKELAHIDVILKQLAADEKFEYRELVQQVLEEEPSKKVKMLLIRLYEFGIHRKLL